MSNPNALGSPTVASPTRPGGGHQIKRSLTEFTSPVKTKGHHSKQSTHHPHHHHPHRRHRHRDEKEPQTAHPSVNRGSMDMPRPEVLGHNRRTSALATREELGSRANSTPALNKTLEDESLNREVEKAEHRVEGLKQSLADLHTFSSTTTRRLDETYFAVLEKTSALQNTVVALKDLAEASKEIYTTFEKDSVDLEDEITGQLKALGRFEDQETKIDQLQSRIHGGREKIQSLSERVDVVRDRVESWERAAQEWQNRTRRRLAVIWSVGFLVVSALVALTLTFRTSVPDVVLPPLEVIGDALPGMVREGAFNVTKHIPAALKGGGGEAEAPLILTRAHGDDDRLRGFDEL